MMQKTISRDEPRAPIGDLMVTATEGAALLCISKVRVGQLAAEGIFQRVDGRFRLGDLIAAFVKYLREETKRRSKTAGETRVQIARAQQLELRIAREAHTLIPLAESEEAISLIVGYLLTELSSLPASVTRDLPLRRLIEQKIIEIRQRASDKIAAHAQSLRKTGKAAA